MATAAPLEFLPPRLDGRVVAVCRGLLPLWLRRRSRIGAIEVRQVERLVEAMQQFQAGETRLLLAFRHPSLDDPAMLGHLLWNVLPREGRQRGVRWRPAPHAQFLYDRGIPLWAGAATGWMLSRLGGSSIQRGRLDLPGLRSARELLLNGPHPFAAAPEGATNGHNEVVSTLEPGVAQLAFWTADDLARSGRPERMTLLPIGVQYGYEQPVWTALEALLGELERDTGLSPDPQLSPHPQRIYDRLHGLGERMLALMESFYRNAYHRELQPPTVPGAVPAAASGSLLAPRLQALLDTALRVVEEPFGIVAKGDLASRCRRVEQAGWERLYPSTNGAPTACPLQQGLSDRLAEETERRLWHMRVVAAEPGALRRHPAAAMGHPLPHPRRQPRGTAAARDTSGPALHRRALRRRATPEGLPPRSSGGGGRSHRRAAAAPRRPDRAFSGPHPRRAGLGSEAGRAGAGRGTPLA